MSSGPVGQAPSYADDEIDLLDLLSTIYRYRWLIFFLALLFCGGAVLHTMTRERAYVSEAVFLMVGDRFSVGLNQNRNQQLPPHVVLTVLESRELALRVAGELGLQEAWGLDSSAAAAERLQRRLQVSHSDGVLTVRFQDPSPQRARNVVAAVVARGLEELEAISRSVSQEALAFLEERVSEAQAQLEAAESRLAAFRRERGVSNFQAQFDSLVEAALQLEDRIRLVSLERQIVRQTQGEDAPAARELQAELGALSAQLRYMETGEGDPAALGVEPAAFPLQQAVEIELELERLSIEARALQETYQTLLRQMESMRIEASRPVAPLRPIDGPDVPSQPISRQLRLRAALGAALGVMLGVFASFILHFLRERSQDEEAVRALPWLRYFRGSAGAR